MEEGVISKSTPIFNIESGQDEGPVFVRDLLTEQYGPVFTVRMCGADRVTVDIQGPNNVQPVRVNLTEDKGIKGYFTARVNWKTYANVAIGEYKAAFTVDGSIKHEKYFYVKTNGCSEMSAFCAHNRIRQQVNGETPNVHIQPLKWSDILAASAQKHANQLALTGPVTDPVTSKKTFPHSKPSGENIAGGAAAAYTVTQLIDEWFATKDKFIIGRDFGDGASTTGNKVDVAHYTQVVWEKTREVGCSSLARGHGWDILVCHYNPHGNVETEPVFTFYRSTP